MVIQVLLNNAHPLSRAKMAHIISSDTHSDEPQGGVTDGGGHPADLPVFSLGQLESDPAVRHVFAETDRGIPWGEVGLGVEPPGPAGQGGASGDLHATGEFLQGRARGNSFHLSPVGARVSGLRIQQPGVQAGFVAQQQQSFRIGIKAAQRVDIFGETEIGEGSVVGSVGSESGKDAVRFVESKQHA